MKFFMLSSPNNEQLFGELMDGISVLAGSVIAPYRSKGKGKIEPLWPNYGDLRKKRMGMYDEIAGEPDGFEKKEIIVELRGGRKKKFIRQD